MGKLKAWLYSNTMTYMMQHNVDILGIMMNRYGSAVVGNFLVFTPTQRAVTMNFLFLKRKWARII